MLLQRQIPHVALRSFIDYYFLMHLEVENADHPVICPFPPTPLQFIVFYLDDQVITRKEGENEFKTRARCMVVGPQTTLMNLMIRKSHRCFAIAFQPGGLYRLLGIPMKELYDDGFEGREVLGAEMERITEQLQEVHSIQQMVEVTEKFLIHKLCAVKSMLPFDEAMQVLIRHNGLLPIGQIASLSCLSLRQFERKCHERIGYSPKFYARLARFSKAYRMHESQPGLTWTTIAHAAGYYDQMHFIRDFREFAGITPKDFQLQLGKDAYPMQGAIQW